MTKREVRMLEEREMLNRLIVQMNGRQMALKSQLDDFDRDWKALKKKLERHLEKYAKEIEKEDEVRNRNEPGSGEAL